MNKKFSALALAIMAAAGISAAAQTPAACPAAKSCAKSCTEAKACPQQPGCGMEVFFEGITLTPEQQTKIDAIKADRQKAAKEARENKKADRKTCRRDYLNKMKAVLTPEQYVVFLENMVTARPAGRPGQGFGPGRGHGAHHAKAAKCAKAAKACPGAAKDCKSAK